MNVVDAACEVCRRPFRWLSGTPRRCPDCQRQGRQPERRLFGFRVASPDRVPRQER